MNIVILKGNITRDVELKHTPSGVPVAEIGIAINKVWHTDSGERKEKVSFHDCRAWRSTAENIAKHFSKGKPILIEGELTQEEWEDKETGKKRRKTLVIINRFHFAGDVRARPAPEEPEDRRTSYASPKDAATNTNPVEGSLDEDDIPF